MLHVWLCFKLSVCLFGHIRTTSVIHGKVTFVCFIYMQPQKVKFSSVQINMKQVSQWTLLNLNLTVKENILPGCFLKNSNV